MISWLPAAHIAERMAHHYLPIVFGMTVTTCPNPREIVGYLPAVKPTWFLAVPRIWEKLRGAMLSGVFTPGSEDREHLDAAIRAVELQQAGEEVPSDVAETAALLVDLLDVYEEIRGPFIASSLEPATRSFAEARELTTNDLFMVLRVVTTGRTASPPLFETMEVLGKEITRRRVRQAIELLLRQK